MSDHEETGDKDLFGDLITKKKSRASKPSVETKPPQITAPRITGAQRARAYLWRLATEGAHDGAVKFIGTGLAAGAVTAIGLLAQWQYDWIGKTKAEIGEWTTTVERAK